MDDLLEAAVNTYCVLLLGMSTEDIIENSGYSSFFLDVFYVDDLDDEEVSNLVRHLINIFEQHEHYEKCEDLLEWNLETIRKK